MGDFIQDNVVDVFGDWIPDNAVVHWTHNAMTEVYAMYSYEGQVSIARAFKLGSQWEVSVDMHKELGEL